MNYNNTYIGIPLILRRQRSFLLRKFPELIKYRRKYDPIHILEAISIYCEVDANGGYLCPDLFGIFRNSHRLQCTHCARCDFQNLLKNIRLYDPKNLRNALLTFANVMIFCGNFQIFRHERFGTLWRVVSL